MTTLNHAINNSIKQGSKFSEEGSHMVRIEAMFRCLILMVAVCLPAVAQVDHARMAGTIKDTQGAVIPAAALYRWQ